MWMVCGVVGHFGNRVYFNMIHAKIRNTIADISPQQAIQELRKNGGTNKYGWIAPTLIGIILSIPGLAIQNEQAQSAARAEQRVQTTQAVIEPPAVDSAAADQAAADQQRLWNEQAATVEKDRYSAYLKQVERQYPFLNPDSPQHDKDAEAWVAEQLNFYKSQGQNPEMALRSAIVAIEEVFDQKRRREYHSAIDPRLMYQMSQVPGGISQTEATAALCQMSPSACR